MPIRNRLCSSYIPRIAYDNIITHLLSSTSGLAGSYKDNHMAAEVEGFSETQDGEGSSSNPCLASLAYNLGKRSRKLLRPSAMMRNAGRGRNDRTSYLDGLRGFGAFLVYWQHHQLWPRSIFNVRILESSFGFEGKYRFVSLPIVRLFFTGGHFAVAIFLIISGYVLSAKPLALIHSGNLENLDRNLGSALFRRWVRLYGPVILVTFVYMASWHIFGIWTPEPNHKPDFREEIWNWYTEFKNYSFVFRIGGKDWFTYNYSTWTIPYEFRGSIIIYTSLLALSRATTKARLWCEIGLMFYFMHIVDAWYGAAFVFGMFLCELELLATMDELPSFVSKLKAWKTPLSYVLLLISAVLSGAPCHNLEMEYLRDNPGWYYLSFLKPQAAYDSKWFYLLWAAICFITAVPRIRWLKAFFELPFNQYLGRISYSLYLVHGPILWILGDRIYTAVGWDSEGVNREAHQEFIPGWVNKFPLSSAGPFGLEPRLCLPQLILLPVSIWMAEIVTEWCDEPVVKFAQWMYGKTLASPIEIGSIPRKE